MKYYRNSMNIAAAMGVDPGLLPPLKRYLPLGLVGGLIKAGHHLAGLNWAINQARTREQLAQPHCRIPMVLLDA